MNGEGLEYKIIDGKEYFTTFGIYANGSPGELSDRLKKLGRTAYEKEIDEQLQELKN